MICPFSNTLFLDLARDAHKTNNELTERLEDLNDAISKPYKQSALDSRQFLPDVAKIYTIYHIILHFHRYIRQTLGNNKNRGVQLEHLLPEMDITSLCYALPFNYILDSQITESSL